jgi:hypothetical protein
LVIPEIPVITYWPGTVGELAGVAVNEPVPLKPEPEKVKLNVSPWAAEQQSNAAVEIPHKVIQRKHFIVRLRGSRKFQCSALATEMRFDANWVSVTV